MSYIEHIARTIKPRHSVHGNSNASEEMKRQCDYLDGVAGYLEYSGFFSEIQITYLMGLCAGSILCHYHLGTEIDEVGDRIIETHGASAQIII